MNEDLDHDLKVMEIINSHSLSENQIKQLAELIKMKDSLDMMNLNNHNSAIYANKDRRFFPVHDSDFFSNSPADIKKRLILQRFA